MKLFEDSSNSTKTLVCFAINGFRYNYLTHKGFNPIRPGGGGGGLRGPDDQTHS